ncbi:hypothetical protein BOTBODRAFT_29077 [Botryobasidium botryosum FD-172 SS1]|uniref:Eukaryotic translation initiation factor 2A n=1 Tax=Botryobasidium botryosum (strain FD-172 SS1) TaxID=930990 RepID=A0A067MVG9_BOTB1|nr:hypothetical protein BOTBODRAFT_29077 [Botryobasidium botryosum FD-172 SS1]
MANAENTSAQNQYAFRAQKSFGLIGGSPSYEAVSGFDKPDATVKMYRYSQDGNLIAYAVPGSVFILQAETCQVIRELAISSALELNFSPLGTYLSTWERPVKLEDGAQHKNHRVWSVETGEEVLSVTQKAQEGWDLQYTPTESHAVRVVGPEIQVYDPSNWSKGVADKLKVEGLSMVSLSPGKNPSIAVFVGEKKGAPAIVRIYGLNNLSLPHTCQKTFYKADRAQMKWNALGTQVLVFTHTDVDKTGKSYYGETGLYLLSAAGNFDCRVTLDKEGPIHDFAWSPNSKEFGVVYGFTPAKTVLFDQRVNITHDFGSSPKNFISFNPQSRLLILAGFGNLAGGIEVYDRRTLQKVCSIDASNTSWCEWSRDGRFIMTATLSPRLRVDNGIKIWHCTGSLMHVHLVEELYQASWRPGLASAAPPFPNTLPAAPTPSESIALSPVKPPAAKPAGAYRPPGARGLAAPSIFKREDEGGAPRMPSNGISTPPRGVPGSAPHQGGKGNNNNNNNRQRYVPGAAPPGSAGGPAGGPVGEGGPNNRKGGQQQQQQHQQQRNNRKKDGKKDRNDRAENGGTDTPPVVVESQGAPAGGPPADSFADGLDPVAKKIRNLTKKLKAIDELKEKAKRGEKLEVTQLKKIDTEGDIKKELAALGGGA